MNNIKISLENGKEIDLTEKQYEVFTLKDNGKTNKNIANILNITHNAVKKRIRIINDKAGFNVFDPNIDLFIDEDETELDWLKESNRHLKVRLRKYKKERTIEKEILKLFEKELKKYPNHKSFPVLKKSNNKSSHELVINLSDIHAGAIVEKKGVIGLNEYDMNIMEQRMKNIFNNVNSIVNDSNCHFKKLHVFLLGDMVSGIIHNELKEGIAMVNQVFDTGAIIAEMIYKWSKMFPSVEVSCVVGNHGRLESEIKFKNKHDNFDGFMYHAIAIHLKNVKNVKLEIPECPWLIKTIEGKNFLLTHGDTRVPGYNGISYYKIDKMDNNASKTLNYLLNIKIDYIIVAHYHKPAILGRVGGGMIIVNGSIIGTDYFSLFAMSVGTLPIQTMFRVHKKYGVNHIDYVRVLD